MENWIIKTYDTPFNEDVKGYLKRVERNHFADFFSSLPKQKLKERPKAFVITLVEPLEGEDEELIALVHGYSMWDWIYVQTFWIHDHHRNDGIGSNLLKEVEEIAVERKCCGIHLETWEQTNVSFYEKNGFQVYGALEDHPKGFVKYSLSKRLDHEK